MNKPKDEIEAPARLRPSHIRDRTLSVVAGSPRGYRNVDWPIQIAFEAGRLSSREDGQDFNENTRFLAIREYTSLTELAEIRSGRDSTELDIVKGGSGFPIAEARATAIRKLVSIESYLSAKDRMICRTLAEGHSLVGAVKKAEGDAFKFTISARVRTALDALIEAMTKAHKSGYRFEMRKL